jgi:hypothetical protein
LRVDLLFRARFWEKLLTRGLWFQPSFFGSGFFQLDRHRGFSCDTWLFGPDFRLFLSCFSFRVHSLLGFSLILINSAQRVKQLWVLWLASLLLLEFTKVHKTLSSG